MDRTRPVNMHALVGIDDARRVWARKLSVTICLFACSFRSLVSPVLCKVDKDTGVVPSRIEDCRCFLLREEANISRSSDWR